MSENEQEYTWKYQDLMEVKEKLMPLFSDSRLARSTAPPPARAAACATPSRSRHITTTQDLLPRPSHIPDYIWHPRLCGTLSSDSDNDEPPVSTRYAQYKNTKKDYKMLKKQVRELEDRLQDLTEEKVDF